MSGPSLLGFLKRWWALLLLGPIVAGLAGYAVVLQLPAVYQANVTLIVNRGSVGTTSTADDTAGAESLARTYAEALKTRPILDEAAQRSGASISARDLQQAVTVRPVSGTQLLHLTVEDRDPTRAANLANTIVTVFSEHNLDLQAGRYASSRQNLEQLVATLRGEIDSRSAELQQLRATLPPGDPQLARAESDIAQLQTTYSETVGTYESLRVAEARGLNSVTVVEPAVAVTDPVRPNRPQGVALAVLAGLLVAAGFARAVEYLDDGLRDGERLARAAGLRALGTIPRWRLADGGTAASQAGASGAYASTRRAAEAYRLLLSTLQATTNLGDQAPRTVMVTSAVAGEGKSVTAANLAAALAEAGKRVILVDADVHRPSQMRRFQLPTNGGYSTLVLNPSVSAQSLLLETSIPGLRLLTSGPAPASPSVLFTSPLLAARLTELIECSDVVVFDTPPTLVQPDAALLGSHVDGVLFVVDARTSRGRSVRRALGLLHGAGARVLGAALNRVSKKALDSVDYAYELSPERAAEATRSSSAPLGKSAPGKATW